MTEVSVLVVLAGLTGRDPGPVFDDLVGRAGVSGVVWGALPHEPRFWSVRGAGRRVIDAEPGAAYFQPDPALWSELRLAPRAAAGMGRRDPLAEACREAARLRLPSHVRVSLLRNPRLAAEHPDCAQQDAAGRPHPWGLCPSHPDVRAYVTTMMADLARYAAQTVRLDWLHLAGPPDRAAPSDPWASAPCFCRHCRTALQRWCDVDAAFTQARRVLGIEPRPPGGSTASADWPDRLDCVPPPSPLAEYRKALHRPVIDIVAAAVRAASAHSMEAYITLPERASRDGTGIDAGLGVVDGMPCRQQSPLTMIHRQGHFYAGSDHRGSVCLRPAERHWTAADDPEPDIVYARRGRIADVEFQHYDAMPDAFHDRIGDALSAAGR